MRNNVIALQQYQFTGAWQSSPYTRVSSSVGRWVGKRILSQRAVKPVSAYELRAHNNRQAVYSAKVVEFSKFASDTAKHHSKSSRLQLQEGYRAQGRIRGIMFKNVPSDRTCRFVYQSSSESEGYRSRMQDE